MKVAWKEPGKRHVTSQADPVWWQRCLALVSDPRLKPWLGPMQTTSVTLLGHLTPAGCHLALKDLEPGPARVSTPQTTAATAAKLSHISKPDT